jgi:hypothetical protein
VPGTLCPAASLRQVDVFATRPHGGNPVAVVLDGEGFATPPLPRSGPAEEPLVEHIASVLRIGRAEILDAEWAETGRAGWPCCWRARTRC